MQSCWQEDSGRASAHRDRYVSDSIESDTGSHHLAYRSTPEGGQESFDAAQIAADAARSAARAAVRELAEEARTRKTGGR